MVACVVLAAGASTRGGAVPKALWRDLQGRPLVRAVVEEALRASASPVVVVIGAHVGPLVEALSGSGAQLVENPDWERGRTGSVKAGLRGVGDGHSGTLVWPVDHPFVAPATLRALVAAAEERPVGGLSRAGAPPRSWFVPTHEGRRGHPILLGDPARSEVLLYPDDEPLFRYPRRHPEQVVEVAVTDPGILENVDTPAAFDAALARWRSVRETREGSEVQGGP